APFLLMAQSKTVSGKLGHSGFYLGGDISLLFLEVMSDDETKSGSFQQYVVAPSAGYFSRPMFLGSSDFAVSFLLSMSQTALTEQNVKVTNVEGEVSTQRKKLGTKATATYGTLGVDLDYYSTGSAPGAAHMFMGLGLGASYLTLEGDIYLTHGEVEENCSDPIASSQFTVPESSEERIKNNCEKKEFRHHRSFSFPGVVSAKVGIRDESYVYILSAKQYLVRDTDDENGYNVTFMSFSFLYVF
ncbi:MAG: hypothetical protein GY866_20375, partial [Proteobacteria bacterium]|nr:hypothetical protein [Pseudomonadota bacterium]